MKAELNLRKRSHAPTDIPCEAHWAFVDRDTKPSTYFGDWGLVSGSTTPSRFPWVGPVGIAPVFESSQGMSTAPSINPTQTQPRKTDG